MAVTHSTTSANRPPGGIAVTEWDEAHTVTGLAADDHDHDGTYEVSGAVATHDSDTTSVHGIADTSTLVLTNDSRLSDARTPVTHSHLDGDLPTGLARDTEVTGLMTTHEAAADPHALYVLEAAVPGGELGGTYATPTVDATHSGSTHAAAQAAAEATAASALSTHAGAADPHTGYVKENDANWTDLTDGGATTLHSHAGGAGANTQPALLKPLSWMGAANLTTATALVANSSYFLYVGRVGTAATTCDVVTLVATAAVTITWAEVGVFKGTPVANGACTAFTRLGFTNVATTFNSTGIKKTTVALSGVTAGDHLWVAFGSNATTPFQLRAGLAYHIQDGGFNSLSSTRISTVASPSGAGTNVAATLAVPWCQLVIP